MDQSGREGSDDDDDDDDCDALSIIQNEVFAAVCDYLDLYLEMMNDVKNNAHVDSHDDSDSESEKDEDEMLLLVEECTQGHRDYLDCSITNDPA